MAASHRNPACILSCLVACFSTTALATFITLFAASILVPTSIHNQALAAAVLDILALAALFVFVVIYTCTARRSWFYQKRWTLTLVVVLPFTVAMVISVYVLAWMYNNLPTIKTHGPAEHVDSMIAAAVAMWVISLVSLAIYFALCFRQGSSLPDSIIATSDPLRSYIDVAEHKTHTLSMHTLSPAQNRPVSTFSDLSDQSATPMSSVRSSVQQFLRHGKNPKNVSKQSRDSVRSDSTSERRPSDGFEAWEIAPTSTTPEPSVSLANLRAAQRLETIPGSRPVSPAYPLQGPFPEAVEDLEDEEADEVAESPSFPPFAPSMIRRPSAQQQPQDQSHIHPLFRSDSPIPPPAASPGTIVTASPFAGQVVSPSEAAFGSRSRKGSNLSSRPSSPNPSLVRAGSALSLSRPASSRSIRGLAAQQMQRPRVTMSPSLGDLRAECDRYVKAPRPVMHKRERSA